MAGVAAPLVAAGQEDAVRVPLQVGQGQAMSDAEFDLLCEEVAARLAQLEGEVELLAEASPHVFENGVCRDCGMVQSE